jgi:hypothetical protein
MTRMGRPVMVHGSEQRGECLRSQAFAKMHRSSVQIVTMRKCFWRFFSAARANPRIGPFKVVAKSSRTRSFSRMTCIGSHRAFTSGIQTGPDGTCSPANRQAELLRHTHVAE